MCKIEGPFKDWQSIRDAMLSCTHSYKGKQQLKEVTCWIEFANWLVRYAKYATGLEVKHNV